MVFLLLAIGTMVPAGRATEVFAEKTGQECQACHLDPMGGAELTEVGQGYRLSLAAYAQPTRSQPGAGSRLVRLAALYLHLVTGFMWFGTILYVHLVLRPAYASQGLPRGEVVVGLVSMAVMAVTGSVLTYYKVPSLELLLSSRFGLLLLAKITIFGVMVVSALVVVLVIGPRLKRKKVPAAVSAEGLSLEQLAGFDGRDGRPAYVAYQGRIYDVSRSRLWQGGSHIKRHQAGSDLSELLAQAPHGEDKVLAMPEVGPLLAAVAARQPPAQRVFYFMAYMNLGLVLAITFILALWRW